VRTNCITVFLHKGHDYEFPVVGAGDPLLLPDTVETEPATGTEKDQGPNELIFKDARENKFPNMEVTLGYRVIVDRPTSDDDLGTEMDLFEKEAGGEGMTLYHIKKETMHFYDLAKSMLISVAGGAPWEELARSSPHFLRALHILALDLRSLICEATSQLKSTAESMAALNTTTRWTSGDTKYLSSILLGGTEDTKLRAKNGRASASNSNKNPSKLSEVWDKYCLNARSMNWLEFIADLTF